MAIIDRSNKEINTAVVNLVRWNKRPLAQRMEIARVIADTVAELPGNRSDPFIYDVTMLHLINGVYCPEDYGVSFDKILVRNITEEDLLVYKYAA